MAKRPPKKRGGYTPKARPKRPAASSAPPPQAAISPQAPRRPVPPRRPPADEVEPEPDLSAQAVQGASGRRLKRVEAAPEKPPEPEEPALPPGVSPFSRYAEQEDLSGHLAEGRAETVRVVAIVAGLLFAFASVFILVGGIVVTGLAVTGTFDDGGLLAGREDGEPTHIRDTDERTNPEIAPARRAPRGGTPAAEPKAAPVPQPQPVTVTVPQGILFHELEISCPGGWRGRSRFKGSASTVKSVPPGVECKATFKGSQPAHTQIRAGQTKSCTFEPTDCRVSF